MDFESKIVELFWLDETMEPFICAVSGKVTIEALQEIEQTACIDFPDITRLFDQGFGSYVFRVFYEPEERDEYGRVYSCSYWDFKKVSYRPMCDT